MPPVVQIQIQRPPYNDCGICALSMLLDVPYEDVLGAASLALKDARVHHNGLFIGQMVRTAAKFGITLRVRKRVGITSTDEGVLILAPTKTGDNHAAFVKSGMVFPGDGTCAEVAVYLRKEKYRLVSLLVRDE